MLKNLTFYAFSVLVFFSCTKKNEDLLTTKPRLAINDVQDYVLKTMKLDQESISDDELTGEVQIGFDQNNLIKNILIDRRDFITVIPKEIGLLLSIEKFEISRTQQKISLPDEFFNLSQLKVLSLNENELDDLSSKIGQLTELQKLTLSENNLTTIPSEIGNLINLTELNLGNNPISYLPKELSKLKKLTSLRLYDCNFSKIPDFFKELTALTYLELNGNNLSTDELKRIQSLLPNCEIYF